MLKDDQNPQAMLTLENFSNSIGASVVSVSAQAKQGAKMNEVFQQLQSKFFNELVDGYTKPNDACKNIGHMPTSIARQCLTKLACIIQEDGEGGLLYALLLERVKRELNLMPAHLPTSGALPPPQYRSAGGVPQAGLSPGSRYGGGFPPRRGSLHAFHAAAS